MSEHQPAFDTRVPHIARVYDYWLGGKDNFAADREVGDRAREVYPQIAFGVRANRGFLARAVRYLAAEAGVRQFLDIGTGIPTAGNTHQVAQAAAPDSRIVYTDNDPIVLSHAKALLKSSPEGACDYVDADGPESLVRPPEQRQVLGRAARATTLPTSTVLLKRSRRSAGGGSWRSSRSGCAHDHATAELNDS